MQAAQNNSTFYNINVETKDAYKIDIDKRIKVKCDKLRDVGIQKNVAVYRTFGELGRDLMACRNYFTKLEKEQFHSLAASRQELSNFCEELMPVINEYKENIGISGNYQQENVFKNIANHAEEINNIFTKIDLFNTKKDLFKKTLLLLPMHQQEI
jgi:hypothetical protein